MARFGSSAPARSENYMPVPMPYARHLIFLVLHGYHNLDRPSTECPLWEDWAMEEAYGIAPLTTSIQRHLRHRTRLRYGTVCSMLERSKPSEHFRSSAIMISVCMGRGGRDSAILYQTFCCLSQPCYRVNAGRGVCNSCSLRACLARGSLVLFSSFHLRYLPMFQSLSHVFIALVNLLALLSLSAVYIDLTTA